MSRYSPSGRCCSCVIFEEVYAAAPASPWDVRSGSITPTATGVWELSDDTLAVVTSPPLSGSGYLAATIEFDFDILGSEEAGLVFGYADDDNFNYVLLRGQFTPPGGGGFGGTLYNEFEYWERRAGVDSLIIQRTYNSVIDAASFPMPIQLCWQIGDESIETLLRMTSYFQGEKSTYVGVSSMPGGGYGVLQFGDPVSLVSDISIPGSIDFSAQRNTGDCRCGCYAPGAEPHSPPELTLTVHGIDDSCMPIAEGAEFILQCSEGEGTPHWEWPFSNGWDAEIVGDVLRVRWHKIGGTTAIWEKQLPDSPPKLWCLNETLDSSHLVSNDTGCDMSSLTLLIAPETITGINPTCP